MILGLAFAVQAAYPCDTGRVIEPGAYTLKRAVLVYEATATDADFTFDVYRAWKGPDRGRVRLDWPRERLNGCDGHYPVVAGKRYLLTINCGEPVAGDRFVCKSRAELVTEVPRELDLLTHGEPFYAAEVRTAIGEWAAGRRTLEELAAWSRQRFRFGEPQDWVEFEGEFWSPSLALVHLVDDTVSSVLGFQGPYGSPNDAFSEAERRCFEQEFRECALPFIYDGLVPDPEIDPWPVLDDIVEEARSACLDHE
ncbi:hypothetical protein ABI59_08300 [Acidobacteria bacterium Mor1]|nr:hypothetical protein ABI59_08300 [Acidobacteria bacterium Mor1]